MLRVQIALARHWWKLGLGQRRFCFGDYVSQKRRQNTIVGFQKDGILIAYLRRQNFWNRLQTHDGNKLVLCDF